MNYTVTVQFAHGGSRQVFEGSSNEAIAVACRYLGADAIGVWIDAPDGRHVRITERVAREW